MGQQDRLLDVYIEPQTTFTPAGMDEATAALHEQPCPGCGCEPDVFTYIRNAATKVRVGYHCSCGAIVVNGVMVDFSLGVGSAQG